jgi:Nucleoside-diphosphate-sugar pyrophosphorylase involved in lipopolysaccharide biosynthesis/translation initiation factor 2B, gamma/epsilon subunits (eIF-2Bgamma/eIF-2Bepsilon)
MNSQDSNSKTAIILCGGKGLRLRPLTNDVPKPLVELNGKPILYHVIHHLLSHNIKQIILATGYKSHLVEKFMKKYFSNISYKISDSGDVSIIKRLQNITDSHKEDFILCYGDTISNVDIKKLIRFHERNPNDVIMTSYPITIPFGVLTLDDNKMVSSFHEKPILKEVMNIGYYYIPSIFIKSIHSHTDFVEFIESIIKKKSLKCYEHKKLHITINTLAELENARENIKKMI